ncbi:flippase activity-associated protein Agl23 [Halobacteriaceae archaeon GCM10025711]
MRASLRRLTRPGPALLLVALAGLAARLVALGARVAHQDEARVAHWIIHYAESGTWQYRPIIHGPFLPHVNGVVFSAVGPSDFTARLVVALVGGLLPLTAWLLRDRLRDSEVVALGVLLAANPVLLYYSRFMRNDLLLGAFMLTAFAFFVRTIDTGRARYLFAGTAAFALAFTTKENALLYPVTWAGATVLLLDHRLFLARLHDEDWLLTLYEYVVRTLKALWAWKLPSPSPQWRPPPSSCCSTRRNPNSGGVREPGPASRRPRPGNLRRLGRLPGLLGEFPHARPRLPPVPGLLPPGDGEGRARPLAVRGRRVPRRPLHRRPAARRRRVRLLLGVASVLGYPIVVDIQAAWTTINALVPLALPGAVALGFVGRRARGVIDADDVQSAAAAALLLVVLATGLYLGVASLGGYPTVLRPAGLLAALPVPPSVASLLLVGTFAVVVAALFLSGERAIALDHRGSRIAATVVLLVAAVQVGAVAADTSYANPQSPDNPLVQYAQPAGEMKPTLETIYAIADENEGVDVVFYGEEFYTEGDETADIPPSEGAGWFGRLPLPWYFEQHDVNASSTKDADALVEREPPVIVALGPGTPDVDQTSDDFEDRLPDRYEKAVYQQYLWDRPLVIYVDTSLRRS